MQKIFVILTFAALAAPATAENSLMMPTKLPDVVKQAPFTEGFDLDGLRPSDAGLSPQRAGTLLKSPVTSGLATVRGGKEAKLYKQVAPSVVLVVTNEGLGSGSVIDSDGSVLTNWHVIAGYEEVGIIFKPAQEGAPVDPDAVQIATVVKFDQEKDLALLKLKDTGKVPPALALGNDVDVEIGADVNAIGHPTGEAWTYTKGIVSQIRRQYQWSTQDKLSHSADVIQTQTPINPGNSGGPLFSDSGQLIGVNSFTAEGEGLNFAVSVGEVRLFLASKEAMKYAASTEETSCDSSKLIDSGRNEKDDGDVLVYDTDCDGYNETRVVIPDSDADPLLVYSDRNADGEPDMILADIGGDEHWDVSFYDNDYDGTYELEGVHPDGDAQPSKFIPNSNL